MPTPFGAWLGEQTARLDVVGACARRASQLAIVWPPAAALHAGTYSQHRDVLLDAWAARGFGRLPPDGDDVWGISYEEMEANLRVAWREHLGV